MKAIIQTHSQETGTQTFYIKGKDLDLVHIAGSGYSIIDRAPTPHVVRGVFHNVLDIQLTGKRKQSKPSVDAASMLDQITEAISKTDLSSHICEGFLKAEQITDERSQARWACESNPVATAHPNFDAFINSKISEQTCAMFGVDVARTERDINLERALQAEAVIAELQAKLNQKDELIDELTADRDAPTEAPAKSPFEVRTTVNGEGQTYIAGMGVGVEPVKVEPTVFAGDDTQLPDAVAEVHYEEPATSKQKAKDIKDEFSAKSNRMPGDPTPV